MGLFRAIKQIIQMEHNVKNPDYWGQTCWLVILQGAG